MDSYLHKPEAVGLLTAELKSNDLFHIECSLLYKYLSLDEKLRRSRGLEILILIG